MLEIAHRSFRLAQKTAEAGLDAVVTIAARAPAHAAPALAGAEGEREARLMVQEKFAAIYEGAVGAQMAWGAFLIRSAFGAGWTPTGVSHAMVDVADAATAPARRRVRANARRLTAR